MSPSRSQHSSFELDYRIEQGDKSAKKALEREKILSDVVSLQRILVSLLLMTIALLGVVAFGWLIGTLVAIFVALEYGSIARIGFIKNLSKKLYNRAESSILNFIKKAPFLIKLFRSVSDGKGVHSLRIESRAELQNLVDESENVLTPDEKKLIVHSLSFNDKLVNSIMTPRNQICSINKSEFLGPLALDELHKVGHSRLPVISGDIDHIVGILNLQSLLALDVKRSTTAEKAMEPKVYYIRQDQTLDKALTMFLRSHHHLLIVVNESQKTVGLVTLTDVIETLLGHKIVDE